LSTCILIYNVVYPLVAQFKQQQKKPGPQNNSNVKKEAPFDCQDLKKLLKQGQPKKKKVCSQQNI